MKPHYGFSRLPTTEDQGVERIAPFLQSASRVASHSRSYGDGLPFSELRHACVMARIARLVVPGIPHHVTQRGNCRERTFFVDSDYRLYRDRLGIAAAKAGAAIRAYCLMPNHVHAVATPKEEEGLWRTFPRFAPAHHRSYPRAQPLDRASLAGAGRLGGDG
jgi:hypothetical protein